MIFFQANELDHDEMGYLRKQAVAFNKSLLKVFAAVKFPAPTGKSSALPGKMPYGLSPIS